MSSKGMFYCIVALAGILLLAAPATAQLKIVKVEQETTDDERLENLIHRLEIGMSALEELERRDALEIVQRIANELREKRARGRKMASQEENEEIKTVRRRLKVMRTAVEAFVEANRRDAAELVERAMHARELAIEGRRGEEANRVREQAPNRGQLAEALGGAAKLYREWNMPDRAEALARLAETYAQQWRRQQRAEREGRVTEREHEREAGDGLDSLARRVDIIRLARKAFAEAGDKRNAKVLEGVINYGELALEGVSDERLSKAAEAVPSRANLTEYMNWAAHKYDEWGHEERSAACRKLAEYYARQLRPEQHEGGGEREVEHEQGAEHEHGAEHKHGAEHEHGGEGERGVEHEHGAEGERGVERERGAKGNIEDLNYRIEIMHFAQDALARAEREKWAQLMKRFINVAELQRKGASGEAITKAFEGLSMGTTIELLQKASGLYAEWGVEGRAAACNQLAEFYAARERDRIR